MPIELLLSFLLAAFTQSPVESFALEGAPAALRILHTADGQGEIFPCRRALKRVSPAFCRSTLSRIRPGSRYLRYRGDTPGSPDGP